jgi:pimeloyl-ACP methyl ester carboxylesterase
VNGATTDILVPRATDNFVHLHSQPQRFSGLILVDSPHHGFDNSQTHVFIAGLKANFPATIAAFVGACTPEPDVEHIRRWARNILMKSEATTAVALLETMFGLDLRPQLPGITVLTLVIHGELDALAVTRPEVAQETVTRGCSGS